MWNRNSDTIQRRDFLNLAAAGTGALIIGSGGCQEARMRPARRRPLDGKRILTFNSFIRVNQIEVTRTRNAGFDEYDRHTPENIKALRQALADGWPCCATGRRIHRRRSLILPAMMWLLRNRRT
jgi:hypothetical protein